QSHLPAIGHHQREDVGRELQATLVELIDLSLIGKQLHWNVVGTRFTSAHEELDTLVDAWREQSDAVAERAVALGFQPDGQSGAVSAGSGIAPVDRGALSVETVVRELVQRLADATERIRTRMDRLGELDIVSQDLLTDVVGTLEKQMWMLRAQLGPS